MTLDQIHDADETSLFYGMMTRKLQYPIKTSVPQIARKTKTGCRFFFVQIQMELIKLPLFLIGRFYKKSTLFKSISVNSLPVKYRNQRSGWVNSEMFEKRFPGNILSHVKHHLMQLNVPTKSVLIDNASCHPKEEMLTSREIRNFSTHQRDIIDTAHGPRSE